jgi:hypothetical protein
MKQKAKLKAGCKTGGLMFRLKTGGATPEMLKQEKKIKAKLKVGGVIDNGFTNSTPAVGRYEGGGGIEYADSKFWEDRPVQKKLKAPGYKDGGIHIKKANKGKFTSWAQSHSMGVQEAANHIMAHKGNYSPTIVKRANFARNASKWHHAVGGEVEGYQVGDADKKPYDYTADDAYMDAGNYMGNTGFGLSMTGVGAPIGVPMSIAGGIMQTVGATTRAIKEGIDPNTDVDWSKFGWDTGMGLLTAGSGGMSKLFKSSKYIPKLKNLKSITR